MQGCCMISLVFCLAIVGLWHWTDHHIDPIHIRDYFWWYWYSDNPVPPFIHEHGVVFLQTKKLFPHVWSHRLSCSQLLGMAGLESGQCLLWGLCWASIYFLKEGSWKVNNEMLWCLWGSYKGFLTRISEDLWGKTWQSWIDYWPSNVNKPFIKHCLVITLLLGKLQMRR